VRLQDVHRRDGHSRRDDGPEEPIDVGEEPLLIRDVRAVPDQRGELLAVERQRQDAGQTPHRSDDPLREVHRQHTNHGEQTSEHPRDEEATDEQHERDHGERGRACERRDHGQDRARADRARATQRT
jgi:hypothetical protein